MATLVLYFPYSGEEDELTFDPNDEIYNIEFVSISSVTIVFAHARIYTHTNIFHLWIYFFI